MLFPALFLFLVPAILASDNYGDLFNFDFASDHPLLSGSQESHSPAGYAVELIPLPLSRHVFPPDTFIETTVLYSYIPRTNSEYSMKKGEKVRLYSGNHKWCLVGGDSDEPGYAPCSFLADDVVINEDEGSNASLGVPPHPVDVVYLKAAKEGKALFASENNWCFVVFGDEESHVPCAYLQTIDGSWDSLLSSVSQGFVASVPVPWELAPRIFELRSVTFKLNHANVIELPTKFNAAVILGRSSKDWCHVELVLLDNGPQEIGDEGILPCAFFLHLDATNVNPYTPTKELPRISLEQPMLDYGGHYDPSHHLLPMERTLQYIVVSQSLDKGWLEVSNPETGEWGFAPCSWFRQAFWHPLTKFLPPVSGLNVPQIIAHRFAVQTRNSFKYIIGSYEPGFGGTGHRIDAFQVPVTSTLVHFTDFYLPPNPLNPPMRESSNLLLRFIAKEFWKSFDWSEQEKQFKDLTFHERIGKGTFGSVYRAVSKSSGKVMAVKMIEMAFVSSSEGLLSEITAMVRVKGCKGIPALHHVYLIREMTKNNKTPSLIAYLLMDYIEGPSLCDMIRKKVSLTAEQMVGLSVSLTNTLFTLHNARIVHRDIKPENVKVRLADGTPVLLDLGNCLLCDQQSRDNQIMTTSVYCSPEVITGKHYSYDLDIWSLGIVLLEASQGRLLYRELQDCSAKALRPYIIALAGNPGGINVGRIKPLSLSQFLQQCFSPAHCRPSIKDLLGHPYLKCSPASTVLAQPAPRQQPSPPAPVQKKKKETKKGKKPKPKARAVKRTSTRKRTKKRKLSPGSTKPRRKSTRHQIKH